MELNHPRRLQDAVGFSLLHNCKGKERQRWWRWHCPVISPTALPALSAILRRTISPCTCVSVGECELWSRDGISRWDVNARPTCRMMLLIWTSITLKHPNFSYPHKNPLHCRVHVLVETVRVADQEDRLSERTRYLLRTTSAHHLLQKTIQIEMKAKFSPKTVPPPIRTSVIYRKQICLSSARSPLCPP